MKERVTVTIEKDLLNHIDSLVDKHHIKNRSHAIELLVKKSISFSAPRYAVILAGGKEISKEATVVVGKKTVIENNVDLLKKYGVTNIFIISPKNDLLKDLLKSENVEYIDESQPLGTAGALKLIEGIIEEGPVIVMNADELREINLKRMFEAHKQYGAKATIALTTVSNPENYGVAMMDGNKIMRFVEKPLDQAPTQLISSGLYIIEYDVLKLIPEGFATLEHDLFPKLAREGLLYGYLFPGKWFDMGNKKHQKKAMEEWQWGYKKQSIR